MPELGEIRPHNNKTRANTSIWAKCIDCGKERWVRAVARKSIHPRCVACANEAKIHYGMETSTWKGGKGFRKGYVYIRLRPDDFFFSMATTDNAVLEHRLVMAKHLGRNLHSWEMVHHKNHIRSDNRLENLQLISDDRHTQITILENKISRLEKENQVLRQRLQTNGISLNGINRK